MQKQSLLDSFLQQVENSKSFQRIMADGKVSDAEVNELLENINSLMSKIEKKLSTEDFDLVSELVTELSVFYAVTKSNERIN